MKAFKFYILALSVGILSCKKDMELSAPDFEVAADRSTYKIGDTVNFSIDGEVDYLTFYSGESGNNYENRERTSVTGVPKLSFTSFAQYGTQVNTLKLLVSNDFNGKVDQQIGNANWTDVTSLVTLSTGVDNTPSGELDLTPYINGDKPIFIAFKYNGLMSASSAQKTWTIKNFLQFILTDKGEKLPVISSIASAGWTAVSITNDVQKWTQNATQIQIAGGGANTPDNEDWMVATLRPKAISPDRGLGIKDVSGKVASYQYVLKEAGEREVVFIGSNANVGGAKTSIRKVKISVTP